MPRTARVVIPGVPHHVIQRGNRRQPVFFGDGDYRLYARLIAEAAAQTGTRIWAYCLMPNHVHWILVPQTEDGLRATLGDAHRRYTRTINIRKDWRGHLWQERFHSFPMDEPHLLEAARYIELNPVAAGLVRDPQDWPWSSARAHLAGSHDGVTEAGALCAMVSDWRAFLLDRMDHAIADRIDHHARTGKPLGTDQWLEALEHQTGQSLRPSPRGRPRKS